MTLVVRTAGWSNRMKTIVPAPGNHSRYRALFRTLGMGLSLALALATSAEAQPRPAPPAVTLIVDYGDGVQKRFTKLVWKKDMTVMDALKSAERHPRGIKVHSRGSRATAFVNQIDDLKNQGSRGSNWTFRVNGKLGDRYCGVAVLQARDVVLWVFGSYP